MAYDAIFISSAATAAGRPKLSRPSLFVVVRRLVGRSPGPPPVVSTLPLFLPAPPPFFLAFPFFSFLLLKNGRMDGRTDGRTEKQQEKINKQRLPGTGCTHNIVVILACRRADVFRRTYFRNLAGSGVARLVRARFYFLFAETRATENIKIIRFYITSRVRNRHISQGPAHDGIPKTVILITTTSVVIKFAVSLIINGRLAPDTRRQPRENISLATRGWNQFNGFAHRNIRFNRGKIKNYQNYIIKQLLLLVFC